MTRSLSILLIIIILLSPSPATSCSMFKIPLYGKIMDGNKKDAWKVNAESWFEKGNNGQYDVTYVRHSNPNHEHFHFAHFKTPFNSSFIKLLLYTIEVLLVLLTLFWTIYLLRILFKRKTNIKAQYGMSLLLIMNIALCSYLFILQNNQPLFFFDAPYYVPGKMILNLTAYIPIILLGLIIPVGLANISTGSRPSVTKFTQRLFTLNTIIYLIVLLLFAYWGLLFIIRC